MVVEHPPDVRRASTALHEEPCQSSAGLIDNSRLPLRGGSFFAGAQVAAMLYRRWDSASTAPHHTHLRLVVKMEARECRSSPPLPAQRVFRRGPGRCTAERMRRDPQMARRRPRGPVSCRGSSHHREACLHDLTSPHPFSRESCFAPANDAYAPQSRVGCPPARMPAVEGLQCTAPATTH